MACEVDFYKKLHKKLIELNMVHKNDEINIHVIHKTHQYNTTIYHYLITNLSRGKKFIVRTVKKKDYTFTITKYLAELNKMGKYQFTVALTEPFTIENHTYIATSYFNGNDLESTINKISDNDLISIAKIIDDMLKQIHSITNDKYFDENQFSKLKFNDIIINKLYKQFVFEHDIIEPFIHDKNVDMLLANARNILSNSLFSAPTLIHMDIKPANIILSSVQEIHLVDFELARFGDLDYEWTNILLKTLLGYNVRFKKYVLLPIIKKNFISIERALENNKYKIYLLYLSLNAYIYYSKSGRLCTPEVVNLIKIILNQLT